MSHNQRKQNVELRACQQARVSTALVTPSHWRTLCGTHSDPTQTPFPTKVGLVGGGAFKLSSVYLTHFLPDTAFTGSYITLGDQPFDATSTISHSYWLCSQYLTPNLTLFVPNSLPTHTMYQASVNHEPAASARRA